MKISRGRGCKSRAGGSGGPSFEKKAMKNLFLGFLQCMCVYVCVLANFVIAGEVGSLLNVCASAEADLHAGVTHSSLSRWQKFHPSALMRAMELLLRNSCCREVRPYREPLFTSVRLLYSKCLQETTPEPSQWSGEGGSNALRAACG